MQHHNDLILRLSNKWQLINLRPLAKSAFTNNYALLAYSAHYCTDVVLKICPSDDITYEQRTLHYFNGHGCVKLLDYDIKNNGLLLEYIHPGSMLKNLFPKDDSKAVEITVKVIKELHSHQNFAYNLREFPTINRWLDLLGNYKGDKVPKALLKKAKNLSDKLLSTQGKLFVLHGDLHHENILQQDDSWVAIDPIGVVGELEYEFGAFIRNPVPELLQERNAEQIIMHRIDQFSNIFDCEKQRLIDWSFVQAVLVACWSEWDYYIRFAEIIENKITY